MKGDDNLDLHKEFIVIDMHNDTMMKLVDEESWLPFMDLSSDSKNHIDLNKMKKGNLSVGFFAAYNEPYSGLAQKSLSRTLALINAMYASERNNPNNIKIASSLNEIGVGLKDNKHIIVPTIEGGYSFTRDNAIDLLYQYHDLKVKAIGLTWNHSNQLAEGADSNSSSGLTGIGIELIKHMNKLGMIVDTSHLSESSFYDVIKHSKSPIIASHSGAYSLKAHKRNLKDEQLLALKENRGVVGVVLHPGFLSDNDKVYIKDYVDHIDYIVNLIGIDHVAMGSDFDGASIPVDLEDASQIYKITQELDKRGYSKEDIQKFLGKNVLRIIDEVEILGEKIEESGLEIIPRIDEELSAIVDNPSLIDKEKIRVILNGREEKFRYDEDEGVIYADGSNINKEKFQVVTFEIRDREGLVKRNTIIIYIG